MVSPPACVYIPSFTIYHVLPDLRDQLGKSTVLVPGTVNPSTEYRVQYRSPSPQHIPVLVDGTPRTVTVFLSAVLSVLS